MSRNEADVPPPFDCRLGSGRADDRACGLLPSALDRASRVNGRIDGDDEPVGDAMPRGSGGERKPDGENGGDDGGDDHADGDVANRDAALPLRCTARRESALCGLPPPPPPPLPRRSDRDRDWCGSGEMTGRDAFGDRELNFGDRTPNDDGKGSNGDDDDEDGRRSGELVRSRRCCRSSATR